MTTELLRPGYSNISCTEDQCIFSAVMSTELEVSFQKKRSSVFETKLQLPFNLLVRETGKLYINAKGTVNTF